MILYDHSMRERKRKRKNYTRLREMNKGEPTERRLIAFLRIALLEWRGGKNGIFKFPIEQTTSLFLFIYFPYKLLKNISLI